MEDEKRRKRMKWIAYITAFVIFQTLVILVFVLVVMRVRTPKFRVGDDVRITTLNVSSNSTSPSLNVSFTAPIRVKNKNFGPFKYGASQVNFTYDGVMVGQVEIAKSTANFMATKKFDVNASLISDRVGTRPNSGLLTLNSVGQLSGKVEIMLIFKKKKTIEMNCTMTIDVNTNTPQSVDCK